MKKLMLNTDQLQVESFDATPRGERAGGTVVAHDGPAKYWTIGATEPCICVDQPETRTCNC